MLNCAPAKLSFELIHLQNQADPIISAFVGLNHSTIVQVWGARMALRLGVRVR